MVADELAATGKAVLLAALQADYSGLRMLLDGMESAELRVLVECLAVTAADWLTGGGMYSVSPDAVAEFNSAVRAQIVEDRIGAAE